MQVTPALLFSDVRFGYGRGPVVLDIPHFEVAEGESVFLYGASGAGKSTLLNLAAGTLTPRAGTINVLGRSLNDIAPSARDRLRADCVGVIFQLFNLVPYLSVLENVLLPCRFSALRRGQAAKDGGLRAAAATLLDRLGLPERLIGQRRVSTLSVGQQQRVAAARALIGSPGLIIADEPTSALDPVAQDAFLELLRTEVARTGAALLFVSHNRTISRHFDREVDLAALTRTAGAPAAS